MVIMEFLPAVVAVLFVIALFVIRKAFRLPKSFDETRESRDLIIKQKKKKEELEKMQNNLFGDE